MPRNGILFILVGPSGAGKNTLMKPVQAQVENLKQLATMTTRDIRPGEKEGREHFFVSHAKFHALINAGELVEWQRVHLDDLYGTPRKTVEEALNADRDLIADIDFLGASKVHAAYPDNTVLIFVTPSRLDTLAERIWQRGNVTPEVLTERLERARFEMTFAPRCHYLILNDDLEPATGRLRQIVESERIRHRGGGADHGPALLHDVIHTTVTALIRYNNKLLTRDNTPDNLLPTFAVQDYAQPLHETLQSQLQQTLNCTVHIEAISDSRFEFVAPNHVTISAAPPPDIYLDFTYKCSLQPPLPESVPGWRWQSPAALDLPPDINRLAVS
ncbi:MAG: guanylate kinase [Anaerolineae bacterium]|nr:guanylate kinase [Anaerolineae bacterium]